MRIDSLLDLLDLLPVDQNNPQIPPPALARHLSQMKRIARPPRLSRPMTEYRLLTALALGGWSLRYALVELESEVQGVGPQSGTLNRAVRHLSDADLWQTMNVRIAGRRHALVRLTPKGRDLLKDIGLDPVESEWERIERLHRGNTLRQRTHTAAICVFAHHARCRGYDTEVCPEVLGVVEPDIALLDWANQPLYVEVQGRGGEPWRRGQKWWNLYMVQREVLLCTHTSAQAVRYAHEAQRVGISSGRITDLYTLRYHPPPFLWTHRWQSRFGALLPFEQTEN